MSNILWSSRELADATNGTLQGDWSVNGIEIDSRAVAKNDLFIALKAARDGHQFVSGALNQGANAAMVSDAKSIDAEMPTLLVDDTMLALENIGAAARRRAIIAKRVAITGSVGKTTVKELTAASLSASGKTHKSVKSYNNHFGVPLTLARMPQDTRFGVFEIGMNHGGEIALLSPQVRPHVAAITTVAPVHIEHFGTLEKIADAKAEIFLGLEHNGFALLPHDNPMYNRLKARAKDIDGINILSFGIKSGDAHITKIINHGTEREIHANIFGEQVEWRIIEPGEHWLNNGLCALSITHLLGGEIEAAASLLSSFGALDGRGAIKEIAYHNGHFTLVDEAYNANPTSVLGALEALSQRKGSRKIAVLGDMLELGENENEYHRGLIDGLIKHKTDLVFLAGTRMKYLWDVLPKEMRGGYATTSKELAPLVCDIVLKDDCIMVKGSNGSHMNVIVAALGGLMHSH